MRNDNNGTSRATHFVVTAGATYLDIDAYACMVAMAELLALKGENAIAYSPAPGNYSVCRSLMEPGQVHKTLPPGGQDVSYIIVDVSDPAYLQKSVPLEQVAAVYDHHVGFESYWESRIGANARIEFIGAAATLIYREWKSAGLEQRMSLPTARLLIAAILDNTLNLTASNTTPEDREVFQTLCRHADVDEGWCSDYFSQVQHNVQADLKNALFNDLKHIGENPVLPANIAQLCVWDAEKMLEQLPDIRGWMEDLEGGWMLNIIDIRHRCSWFVCEDARCQSDIERIFGVRFAAGTAKSSQPYLRKQILKNVRDAICKTDGNG